MKSLKLLLFIFFVFLLTINLFADDIYLNNGKVLNGQIVKVDKKWIRYRYKKYSRLRYIAVKKVVKIVYSDGSTTRIKEVKYFNTDKIYLNDLNIKYGKVLKVTSDKIVYDPVGKSRYEECDREDVVKIVYKNGEEIVFSSHRSGKKLDYRKRDRDVKNDEKDSSWYIGFSIGLFTGGATVRGIGRVDDNAPSATDHVWMMASLSSSVGYIINPKFRIGLDYTAALGDVFFDDDLENDDKENYEPYEYADDWTMSMHTFSGVMYYSPKGGTGFFTKVAVGWTQIRLENKEIDLMEEASGIAFTVGVGYEWKVSGNFHLSMNIDYFNNHYFDDPVFSRAQGGLGYCTFYWR